MTNNMLLVNLMPILNCQSVCIDTSTVIRLDLSITAKRGSFQEIVLV